MNKERIMPVDDFLQFSSVLCEWHGTFIPACKYSLQLPAHSKDKNRRSDLLTYLKVMSDVPHDECRWGAHLPHIHLEPKSLNSVMQASVMPDLWLPSEPCVHNNMLSECLYSVNQTVYMV